MNQHDTSGAALVGLWKLKEAYIADQKGRRIAPAFGGNPRGYIAYMADGMMVSVIADADQPTLSGDRLSAPAEERAEAFSNSNAYAGRFRFDGHKVVHTIDVCTNPNWVGTEVIRFVEIAGDEAVYSTEAQPLGGVSAVVRLVWTRHRAEEP